jgi:ATP adenylyltransferase
MPYLKRDSEDVGCVFCEKINAKDDEFHHVLYRSTHTFITLNLYPYNNGHVMVVPFEHKAQLEEFSADTLSDLMVTTQKALKVLQRAYNPNGFNIGINLGKSAGAGIANHLHQHIVPRWNGDTNFLSVVGETRTIPEWIDQTYAHLRKIWSEVYPE